MGWAMVANRFKGAFCQPSMGWAILVTGFSGDVPKINFNLQTPNTNRPNRRLL